MKRFFFFFFILAFVMTSATVYAEQKASLGVGNVAVKIDYINFTYDDWEDLDVDEGFYIGLEGYTNIIVPLIEQMKNLYVGMEVGYANPDGKVNISGVDVKTELTYVPIEVNLKYAVELSPNVVIDIGAGASYNYVKFELNSADDNDWVFSGQFFADLTYKIGQLFIGINGKYQTTEDFSESVIELNNWRIGGQIGITF